MQAYIAKQWTACKVKASESSATVLDRGQALILLDGLDEVQETDHDRILEDIKDFTREFRDCQFVMTCRIAAREYIFQQFTEVEVADFSQKQIAEFATKWFKTKQDSKKGKNFIQCLKNNKPIQELATNPLLLTLLCLVFGEAAEFPSNRSELYEEGLDVLLKKWDAKRNIERDQVYKKLSLKRKEDLLSQLAFQTFEQGDYFFKQKVVEQQILNYIRNLPGANEDEDMLQLDSEAVLKSIEAQHGLLVERARGIYSFSHLTFQEYFTARQITRPTPHLNSALENLANHITKRRYREVFLIASQILPESDALILLTKIRIDKLSEEEDSLRSFIHWINAKTKKIDSYFDKASIRTLYFSLYTNLMIFWDPKYDFKEHLRDSFWPTVEESDVEVIFKEKKMSEILLDHAVRHASRVSAKQHMDDFLESQGGYAMNLDIALHNDLNNAIDCSSIIGLDELSTDIKKLKKELPNSGTEKADFKKWWKIHSEAWILKFQECLDKHFHANAKICFAPILDKDKDTEMFDEHEEFNDYEKFDAYIYAVGLLRTCLNSDCYVTKATRQEIEETLLLPMSEIEKRKGVVGGGSRGAREQRSRGNFL